MIAHKDLGCKETLPARPPAYRC